MVKTKDELLNLIKSKIGDDTSDDSIALIEDITDTITDYENKIAGDGVDWKAKYEENDAEWRTRYRDRFFNPTSSPESAEPAEEPDGETTDITFKDLFTGKE